MFRLFKSIFLISFLLFFCATLVFAEDITITTYYPSPYGSYSSLQADKLGVGDNNGDNLLTAADVPTNSGDVWIKGYVGIGTGGAISAKLHVVGGASRAIYATSSATGIEGGSVNGNGVIGTSSSGSGVYATSSTGNGVYAISNSGTGVYAVGTGVSNGVTGLSGSGRGVYGESSGTGVYGHSTGNSGVEGRTDNGWAAIYAKNNNPSNWGIYCEAAHCGGSVPWSPPSDERLKTNITTVENALDKVKKLRGVRFEWKSGPAKGNKDMGFIAQEAIDVVPELIKKDSKTGYYAMAASQITAVLVEAMKEQQKQIKNLTAQNTKQQKEINQLKEEVNALKSKK